MHKTGIVVALVSLLAGCGEGVEDGAQWSPQVRGGAARAGGAPGEPVEDRRTRPQAPPRPEAPAPAEPDLGRGVVQGALEDLASDEWMDGFSPSLAGGTIALLDGERRLAVVAPDRSAIVLSPTAPTEDNAHEHTLIEVAEGPAQLVVGPEDDIWLTSRRAGVVSRISDPLGAADIAEARPCPEPYGLALSPDARTLYVACVTPSALVALNTANLVEIWRTELSADPRGVAVAPDGGSVHVAHLAPGGVTEIELDGDRARRATPLTLSSRAPVPRMGVAAEYRPSSSWAVAPHARRRRVYAPHLLVSPALPEEALTSAYYAPPPPPDEDELKRAAWPALTAYEPGVGRIRNPLSDERLSGQDIADLLEFVGAANLPVAAAHSPTEDLVIVVMRGTSTVLAYATSYDYAPWRTVARWRVGGGADGVAISSDGGRAYVNNAFDGTVSVLEIQAGFFAAYRSTWTLDVGSASGSSPITRGRRLFSTVNNREASGSRGVACAVCHPDGGSDRSVWRLPAGARNPPALAGRVEGTGPYNWGGDQRLLKSKVAQAIGRMRGRSNADRTPVADLVAYLESLPAPPSLPLDPFGRALVEEGEAIFRSNEAGCSGCHSGPRFTDRKRHALDREFETDTPSLVAVRAGGPWFSDGRYDSLKGLLRAQDGRMGAVGHLDERQLDALVAFLEQL